MSISKKIILAAMLSTTALASVASAADENYFAQFNLGYAWALKETATGTTGATSSNKAKMGHSGSYGLELGGKINENFRLSVSLDYLPGFKPKNSGTDANGGAVNTSFKAKSLAYMVNAYWDIVNYDGFTPYIVAGLGGTSNKVSSFSLTSTAVNGNLGDHTDNQFAWKLGLGGKYDINDSVALNLQYQYMDLGKVKSGAGIGQTTGKQYGPVTSKLRVNEVLVGIAYKF